MNRDLFIKTIYNIIELNEESEKFNDLMCKIDSEFGGGYIHNKSISILLSILKELVDDDDMIDYFCWELDFGKKWYPGCIIDSDGTNIKLSTPEELWEAIKK